MRPLLTIPYVLGHFVCGAIMLFHGTVLSEILTDFQWDDQDFGTALTLMGISIFLGMRVASRNTNIYVLKRTIRLSFFTLAAGLLIIYTADLILPNLQQYFKNIIYFSGFIILGAGFGMNGVANNSRILQTANGAHNMNVINLAFTVGGTLLPFVTWILLSYVGKENLVFGWRTPIIGLACFIIMLPLTLRLDTAQDGVPKAQRRKAEEGDNDAPNRGETQPSHTPSKLPLFLCCAIMFCYLGVELNSNNYVVKLSSDIFKLEESMARGSTTFLWLGLLCARLGIVLLKPPSHFFPTLLTGFSCASFAVLIAMLSAGLYELPLGAYTLRLLYFTLGTVLGSMYSLSVASITIYYEGQQAIDNANHVVKVGAIAVISLPFIAGLLAKESLCYLLYFITFMALLMMVCSWGLVKLQGREGHLQP